jgi:hypothetical protein
MADHHHNHSKRHGDSDSGSLIWKPHKDWRVWLAVLLMLAAILSYVLTLDESIVPR